MAKDIWKDFWYDVDEGETSRDELEDSMDYWVHVYLAQIEEYIKALEPKKALACIQRVRKDHKQNKEE